MSQPAAFFDLDRTLIAKSSSLAFGRPFYEQGLVGRRAVLKSSYAQFLFQLSGADHQQMDRLRKHLADMCAGWDVAEVKAVVAETLRDIVEPMVFAEATELIAAHKARGHRVVIVSASGQEVVEPIAKLLGADHAMATKMSVQEGKYTGEVDFYCFGEGKVEAMAALAEQEDFDLSTSYAYADSITDLPMLTAVGNPTAVNPDRALRKAAGKRDWPVLSFSNPVSLRARILSRTAQQLPKGRAALISAAGSITAAAAGTLTYFFLTRKRG
ncbi:MAG: HAD family hydrolase [Segniliparus sp.]|uniref:HAD family hydrolase n=1 Tax=Segniliparus sp. TaxID=2804064 RepID=UPI003F32B557